MSILLKDFLKDCNTGDLLLYSTSHWYSKIIEYFTSSKFSHISIILRDPTFIDRDLNGLYVLESGYEKTPDPTDGKHKFGVQIKKLEDVINDYKTSWMGGLYYRKLDCNRKNFFNKKVLEIYKKVYDKPYDIDICDWIKAEFKIKLGNENKENKFWCSALVAYFYCKMGYLNYVPWTIVSPKEFSYYEDNNSLNFINCTVEPEKYINL